LDLLIQLAGTDRSIPEMSIRVLVRNTRKCELFSEFVPTHKLACMFH
jgi:hypothetical protein